MVDYTFLKSDARDKRAGGGAYIGKLADALRQAGHDVAVNDGIDVPPDRIAVVDGLALAAFAPVASTGALADAVALVHTVPTDAGAPLRMFRRTIATSESVAAGLIERYGIAPDRMTVVTPGVADAERSPGSGGGCEILSIGALVPRKGHAMLIEALNRLFDLDWRLTIVGDTQRDQATTATLRMLAPGDRVRFAGGLDDAALELAWQGADLFALATRWEGYPAAVAEALRHGVPVAVTRPAGALVTPHTGVVCEAGDVDQFSKALRRLIYDAALRSQLAEAAWHAGQALPSWAEQAARFVAATA